MAKAKIVNFTVTGSGEFPVDMLRYDACWPRGPGDAVMILTPESLEARQRRRNVRLASARPDVSPTPDRWRSFGWTCVVEGEE